MFTFIYIHIEAALHLTSGALAIDELKLGCLYFLSEIIGLKSCPFSARCASFRAREKADLFSYISHLIYVLFTFTVLIFTSYCRNFT